MTGYVFRYYRDPLDPTKGGGMVAVVADNEAAAQVLAWQSFDYQRNPRYSAAIKLEQVECVGTATEPACLLWSLG